MSASDDRRQALIPRALDEGFRLLRQAALYARSLSRSPWDFAVEIESLRRLRFTDNDLRWLVWSGWAAQACETSGIADVERRFELRSGSRFEPHSCFVLTPDGERAIAEWLDEAVDGSPRGEFDGGLSSPIAVPASEAPRGDARTNGLAAETSAPSWCADRQELRFRERLVKVFRLPSPNQETVLAAFEEEGWPCRIDDPLPPVPDLDPKRRLHDTIKSLNRNQRSPLVRFLGDGTGLGVRWRPTDVAVD